MVMHYTLTGGFSKIFFPKELEKNFYGGTRFLWIRNLSSEDIYASSTEEDTSDDITIKPKESYRFELTPNDYIFVKGTGDIELSTTAFPEAPYSGSGGGGDDAPLTPEQMSNIIDIINGH